MEYNNTTNNKKENTAFPVEVEEENLSHDDYMRSVALEVENFYVNELQGEIKALRKRLTYVMSDLIFSKHWTLQSPGEKFLSRARKDIERTTKSMEKFHVKLRRYNKRNIL